MVSSCIKLRVVASPRHIAHQTSAVAYEVFGLFQLDRKTTSLKGVGRPLQVGIEIAQMGLLTGNFRDSASSQVLRQNAVRLPGLVGESKFGRNIQ